MNSQDQNRGSVTGKREEPPVSQKLKIPEDLIKHAIAQLSERDQIRLWHTKWKDGIDIEVPSRDVKEFAEAIARPYIERIAKAEADSRQLYEALVGLLERFSPLVPHRKNHPVSIARAAIHVYESRGTTRADCSWCHGRGYLQDPEARGAVETCDHCNGSGKDLESRGKQEDCS